ncbi:chemotaxis protein CheX [Nocardioides terrae]|uniref:Chemotaxis protein CheX n=1 Tax=Nocardioides terrae TaxID=574651 RepID=A0A1I1I8W1_9ACTN|nr:chemotaxis protein CheX [Nocardioides terrae]SFC32604.1 chemotaxis protein CheX [Nocardioides terrae]
MTLAPALTDVHAIVDQVWTSFLGEVEPLLPADVAPGGPFPAGQAWSAAVSVSGGWDATVTVELSAALAVSLTTTMLGLEGPEAPDDADLADAVGELVNMVGGNLKSLMPGPSALSLPAVAAGRAAHASGATEIACFDGVWAGEPVRVTVHVVTDAPVDLLPQPIS